MGKSKGGFSKILNGSGTAVLTMFIWELLEEGLENLIAYLISSAVAIFVAKAFTTLGIILATQGLKTLIKRFLFPQILKLTYKDGNDKMEKLKKFGNWLNANKFTLLGIADGAVIAISGAGLINVSAFAPLYVGSFNITPVLYYLVLGAIAVWASFFPESYDKFKRRIDEYKAEKEAKNIERVAKKELANEKKSQNQTQAQQEKAQAKAQADAIAKAEKEKAEREFRAKVDAEKSKLRQAEAQKG